MRPAAADAATATLVKDINPGPTFGTGCCGGPMNVAGTLFFAANDGRHGDELWRSDGTAAGTRMVADTAPGNAGLAPSDFGAVGATLFFEGFDPTHGFELWKSDGTASGTTLVKDINTNPDSVSWEGSSYPSQLTGVGNQLFFVADDGIHDRCCGGRTGRRRVPGSSRRSTPERT